MIGKIRSFLFLIALGAGWGVYAQTDAPKGKVGYASIEFIISQLPELKEIQADLKSTHSQLSSQIQARSQEVQKQYQDFTAKARSMPDTIRENTQKRLQAAMMELEQMQQDAQRTLENKEKLAMAPLYLKVNSMIREVAVENGFDIILTDRVSGVEFLLFSSQQYDISNLVLQKFGVTPAEEK